MRKNNANFTVMKLISSSPRPIEYRYIVYRCVALRCEKVYWRFAKSQAIFQLSSAFVHGLYIITKIADCKDKNDF